MGTLRLELAVGAAVALVADGLPLSRPARNGEMIESRLRRITPERAAGVDDVYRKLGGDMCAARSSVSASMSSVESISNSFVRNSSSRHIGNMSKSTVRAAS